MRASILRRAKREQAGASSAGDTSGLKSTCHFAPVIMFGASLAHGRALATLVLYGLGFRVRTREGFGRALAGCRLFLGFCR